MGAKRVYLDNNATTRVDDEVVKYMNIFHLFGLLLTGPSGQPHFAGHGFFP